MTRETNEKQLTKHNPVRETVVRYIITDCLPSLSAHTHTHTHTQHSVSICQLMRILLALLLPAAAAAAATAADVGTDNASCRPPVVISRRSTDEHVQCTPLFVIVLMVSILATSAIKKNLTKCLSRVVSDAHFRRRLQLPLSQGSRLILRFAVNFIQRNRQTLKQRNPPPHALPAILP